MEGELNITESDILKLLTEARDTPTLPDDPPGALTCEDMANELGLSVKTVRRWIREFQRRQIPLEIVSVMRRNIIGKPYQAPAFILRGKPDEPNTNN